MNGRFDGQLAQRTEDGQMENFYRRGTEHL